MRSALRVRPVARRGLPAALAALLCSAGPLGLLPSALLGAEPGPASAADGWTSFEATWSASGQRRALRAGDREPATVHLSGSLVVHRGEGLARGFRAEVVAYDDGEGSGLGTMVLTDGRGDQVFARLTGAASQRATLVSGVITGGTGPYAGLAGDFSFEWRHFVRSAEGEIQGLAERFRGRTRRTTPSPPGATR